MATIATAFVLVSFLHKIDYPWTNFKQDKTWAEFLTLHMGIRAGLYKLR